MKMDMGIWDKLTLAATVMAIIAGIALVFFWYLPLINKNERMRKQILIMAAQIQQEEATGKKIKASIDAIQHDPKTVERMAREKLGYARPGETVIRFENPAAPSVATPLTNQGR